MSLLLGLRARQTPSNNPSENDFMTLSNSSASLAHRRLRPSSLLFGLDWNSEASRYPGMGSDMHWLTWGSDDHLHVIDDDRTNFGSPFQSANLLKVEAPRSVLPYLHRSRRANARPMVVSRVLVAGRVCSKSPREIHDDLTGAPL
jgi:hypothetical protein